MCGFISWIGDRPVPESLLDSGKILQHRGPDDSGNWIHPSEKIAFIHRRLSIIDIQGGTQPMSYEGNAIAYNGETYNFRALRSKLKTAGFSFKTDSDTEVILKGYLHWGTEIFDRVRGMFSLAIWDEKRSIMLLARDHLGQKPLFYFKSDNHFIAASEMQALLEQDTVCRRLNREAFPDYFKLGYISAPKSAIKNVKKLPPGHFMTINSQKKIKLTRYWNPIDYHHNRTTVKNPLKKIRDTVRTAVKRRLVSDVPVGAFLSGGIDSSIIVSLMQQLNDEPTRTVTVGFEQEDFDERKFARQIARDKNTEHHEYGVDINLSKLLPKLIKHFGEPFADSSAVPTYYVARQTRKVVKVALSGDGGDELFGGYRRYRAMQLLNTAGRLSPAFLRKLLQAISKKAGIPASRSSKTGELLRILQHLGENEIGQYTSMVGIDDQDLSSQLLNPHFLNDTSVNQEELFSSILNKIPKDRGAGERFMLLDLLTYLPGDLLVKTDITTMMNSLECRCPFLDRDVVELALSLPENIKIKGTLGKACLREAFSDLLPPEIKKRGKMGFGVPLASWFRRGPESDYLTGILLEKNSDFFTLMNRQKLEKYLRLHRDGKIDIASFLWATAVFKLWFSELNIKI